MHLFSGVSQTYGERMGKCLSRCEDITQRRHQRENGSRRSANVTPVAQLACCATGVTIIKAPFFSNMSNFLFPFSLPTYLLFVCAWRQEMCEADGENADRDLASVFADRSGSLSAAQSQARDPPLGLLDTVTLLTAGTALQKAASAV